MVKEYILQGLDCANCAAKIERAVKEQEGVVSAEVNFINTTLCVRISGSDDAGIREKIEKTVHKYEPDIVVADKAEYKDSHAQEYSGKKRFAAIVAGTAVFICGLLLEHLFHSGGYVRSAVFLTAYVILGSPVVIRALKNIVRGQVFDENFLMSIATVGAFLTGNYPEAAAVMLFYQIGEYFQDMAVRRSKRSITHLMDMRPEFANLKMGDRIVRVAPDAVKVGDVIVVKPGEKIPLDGIVIDGASTLDTAALTGESLPGNVKKSDKVLSGCINLSGVLTIEVMKLFGESAVSQIISMVQNAGSKKAKTENFITKFARYYTPAVVGAAVLLAIIPPLFVGDWAGWINRGLIFLVISCPCALVISIPLSFFGGIGAASKKGVLVKGGNFLEALYKVDTVVFDKTGTLTEGVFEVSELVPADGFDSQGLMEAAAAAESLSNHPVARSILKAYGGEISHDRISGYVEIPGRGVRAVLDGKRILAGNKELMTDNNIRCSESNDAGTRVYVAVNEKFAGSIAVSDRIKADSYTAIKRLKRRGVKKTVMLTGDQSDIAYSVARELNIDEEYGGLLPADKVEKVEQLLARQTNGAKLAFIGDGINDAPVLARADIGIAMGGLGSDAAIEAADVVIMTDEPSKIADAIDIARLTRRVVWQNIIFALGIKGLFLLMGAFGVATMWEAVFADVGVSLAAVLNALRTREKGKRRERKRKKQKKGKKSVDNRRDRCYYSGAPLGSGVKNGGKAGRTEAAKKAKSGP